MSVEGTVTPNGPLAPDIPFTALILQQEGSEMPHRRMPEGSTVLTAFTNSETTTLACEDEPVMQIFCLIPKDESMSKAKPSSWSVETTESQQCWSMALMWLEDCSTHHPECRVPDQPEWYPTRLLRIHQCFYSEDHIQLVISHEERLTGAYLTLSHRWGDAVNMKLTRDNLHDLKKGIDVSRLPLTFQQAISVTKRLGKQYIWIDSLCISQDEDKIDWLHEAAMIGKVYANSFLNIAATGAMDGSEGLFRARDPTNFEIPELSIPMTFTADKKPGPSKHFLFHEWLFFERELMQAPLNQRGWVLQERLLSKRVLHFGSRQLFWDCRHGVRCEKYPDHDTIPPLLKESLNASFKSFDTSRTDSSRRTTPLSKYHLWSKISRAYSMTNLSFPSDKAVAISGIAKEMSAILNDEYIAGMWRQNLESQLTWSLSKKSKVSTRAFAYRAPTWSWLSVDGEVGDELPYEPTQIKILDISMKYATADATGIILDGSLRIQGRLRSLILEKFKGKHQKGHIVELDGMYTLTIGGRYFGTPLEEQTPGVPEKSGNLVELDNPVEEAELLASNNELFIMSVGGPRMAAADSTEPGQNITAHVILMVRCVDRVNGVFHRFGVARLLTEMRPDYWALFQEPDLDRPEHFPCVGYDAENKLHTIILK